MVKSMFKVRKITNERVINSLLLTDIEDFQLLNLIVPLWSEKQKLHAYEWALREHIHASDNPNVRRIKCPKHVKAIQEYLPRKVW